MNFIEMLKEMLLALCIATIIPFIVYWGVDAFYSFDSGQKTLVENIKEESQSENIQEPSKNRQFYFWPYIIVAISAIFVGAFVKINSLSLGFIGGGFFSLIAAINHNYNTPILNFGIFLFFFIGLILIIIAKKNHQYF